MHLGNNLITLYWIILTFNSTGLFAYLKTVGICNITYVDILTQWSKNGFCLSMLPNVKSYILVTLLLTVTISSYTLYGIILELLEDMCNLGVYMDSKLKFHNCTDFVVNKANCILGLTFKVFECKDLDIILKLCKPLVHPLLECNNAIWGPHYVMNKRKVETIQQ